MTSRESCRTGRLATLLLCACLITGGCAGSGNGTSAGGTGGSPSRNRRNPRCDRRRRRRHGWQPGYDGIECRWRDYGNRRDSRLRRDCNRRDSPDRRPSEQRRRGGDGWCGERRPSEQWRSGRTGWRDDGGAAGAGGIATGGAGGSTAAPGKIFSQCRFHFGTTRASGTLVAQLDFFTPGWMMGTFNQKSVCTSTNPGGSLAGLVPVDVTYISANYVKNKYQLCDCNVSGCAGGNLCTYGSQYITQEWANILAAYTSNSTGFAACLGGRPIIFEMEPDWYQYTGGGETQPWTAAQAGTNMTALVNALKSSLPNAVFSMDISPWIANNGANWYPNFDMTLFTFINTSGGGTDANNVKIRANNSMTWAGVSKVTGKPILADTGYGANGAAAGEDVNWNDPVNINARMLDGVVSISQYSPTATWGDTIASIRGQLNTPPNCY